MPHTHASAVVSIELPSSGIEIEINVDYAYRAGHSGRTYGAPEDCFEAEAAEIEIVAAHGVETGLCVMDLLSRETVERQVYPWHPVGAVPLSETVIEDLLERGDPDADASYWRRAA